MPKPWTELHGSQPSKRKAYEFLTSNAGEAYTAAELQAEISVEPSRVTSFWAAYDIKTRFDDDGKRYYYARPNWFLWVILWVVAVFGVGAVDSAFAGGVALGIYVAYMEYYHDFGQRLVAACRKWLGRGRSKLPGG